MEKKVVIEKDFELTSNTPDDPRAKKRWGVISALPSEYLIHFRKGKIRDKSSGQGATCFKFLKDTVFIIPTSLKEIIFEANQLTADNVDVKIRGMAVYRISNPLKIYKLINFSNRQNAEGKLARMIADMCRSTEKWLVANMKVEECIRKRKEEIAEALKKEVSRVVADDKSGWGLEIVTIDIQDVYIQDSEIFNAMQMQFKSGKLRESKLAQLEVERELEVKKLEVERSLAEQRKDTILNKDRIEAEIKEKQIMFAKQNDEKQFELDKYRVEQNEDIAKYKLHEEIEREKSRMTLMLEKTEKTVEAERLKHQEEIESLRTRIQVENSTEPISLEREFIEKALPNVAHALAQSMKDVRVNIIQGGQGSGAPFNIMLADIMQILRERLEAFKTKGSSK